MSDDEHGDAPARGSAGDGATDQPTVAIGSDGYDPDATRGPDQGTTAGLENAIPDAEGSFDWRGWVLVGVVAVCFLGLPVLVALRPVQVVGFRTTYLLVPLVPAVVLGATAVWVAVRSRQGER